VTELLENDLLKKSVNIEELRNRFGKNFDKLLFQNALDDLCRENKLVREAGGCRTPKRCAKLNSTQDQLVGQVFQFAEKIRVTPFSMGQIIELSKKKYPKLEIQKIISEKKSFTLSDSTEILGFGRTKGAPIFDYLDSIGFTKQEGNIRTLK